MAVGPDNLTSGAGLSTYKFALASTVEFTEQICSVSLSCNPQTSSEAQQRTVASAALDQIVSEVNTVFQSELAIRFELVPDNDLLISTGNAANDGYTDSNIGVLISENGPVIESRLTISNVSTTGPGERNEYDLAHVLAAGAGGGLATLGVVAQTAKAQGVSGINSSVTLNQSNEVVPTSSFLGVLLHELGHQFGGEHSFNGIAGSCAQREVESSYEPGSGSTIMAYQGICGSDNLPFESGDERFFHAGSYDEIQRFIARQIPSLRPPVSNGNTVPSVDAGPDFTIPAGTPFTLTASASDPDSGDNVTYSWEQMDLGSPISGQSVPIPDAADAVGPLFRSFAPVSDPSRTFPRLSDILANTDPATNSGEHLPTQSREMNFRVTARDNHDVGGSIVGGVSSDDVRLNVVDTGEAFRVTTPNTFVTWSGGANETVNWAVAGTTANGIDTPTVNLRLSTDGGNSFPILLGNFTNNGSAQVVVPNLDSTTTQARIKVEASGNVFFDISDQNFTINAAAAAGVTITETGNGTQLWEDSSIVADQYQVSLDSTPTGGANVTVTVTADAQSQVSLTGLAGSFFPAQDLTFNNTTPQTIFVRAFNDVAVEGIHTSTISHVITATGDETNYPTSLPLTNVVATVIDDDTAVPASGDGNLVGIDFDPNSGSTPTNWTRADVGGFDPPNNLDNLIDEAGNTTTFDLVFVESTGSGTSFPTSGSLPAHTPSLSGLDGVLFSGPFGGITTPIDVIWTGLTPGFQYDTYAFALENFQGVYNQRVTITGDGTPISFNQVTTNGTLLVNDEVGSDSRSLESYAERVTATEFGTIRIRVEANAGSPGIVVPGLAIQEVIPTTTIDAINASDLNKLEGDSGTTPFTFTVSRSGDVSAAATLDFAVTGTGGNPAQANDFGGPFPSGQVQFLAGQATSEAVTLNVTADTVLEPDERFVITLSNPSDGARLDVGYTFGTIENEDTTPAQGGVTSDTIGLYQPDAPLFHLRNSLSTGGSDQFFAFGPGGNAGWTPLSGDWDGDGTDTIGLYQPDVSLFHLKNSFTPGGSDQYFAFGPGGNAGWIPLAGDWNGDGIDTVGLYQPDVSLFHLKDSFTAGASDQYFYFGPGGNAGWIPLVGDWNGDGTDTIGLYQPDISLFHLKDTFTPGASDQYFYFGPGGNAGWTPVTGDWNADGTDTIGLYEPEFSRFHLKDSFTAGASDHFFAFGPGGNAGWVPMTGDWNGPESPAPPPMANSPVSSSAAAQQKLIETDLMRTSFQLDDSLAGVETDAAKSQDKPNVNRVEQTILREKQSSPYNPGDGDKDTDHEVSLKLLDEIFLNWW